MNSYLCPAESDQTKHLANMISPTFLFLCKPTKHLKKSPKLLQEILSHPHPPI